MSGKKPSDRFDQVFDRTVYKNEKGVFMIFTPYATWEGKECKYYLPDQDYKTSGIAKSGKLIVKSSVFKEKRPNGKLEGEKVKVWLEEKEQEIQNAFIKPDTV